MASILSIFASNKLLAGPLNPCSLPNPFYDSFQNWPNPISVSSTDPDGTVLATITGRPDANYGTFVQALLFQDCTVYWQVDGATPNGSVWSTNVPGVGLRVTYGNTPVTSNGSQSLSWLGPVNIFYTASMKLELIKTGSITSAATLNMIRWAYSCDYCNVTGGGGGPSWNGLYLGVAGGTTIQPAAPTCSLSTSNATFDMGTLATTAFTGGAGSTLGWVADQSLISAGCNASTVAMTFAGTAAPAPYSNAFANAGGTARGVALELWQKNGAQAIPNSSTPINFVAQGAGGRYTFSARYLQTAPTVTAGTVNATATVTLNYK